MPNTVVTGTTNAVKVVFNDDSTLAGGRTKATFAKSAIEEVILNDDHVEVWSSHDSRWICHYTTNSIDALIVDSIDSVAPSDLSDLYDKISALIE